MQITETFSNNVIVELNSRYDKCGKVVCFSKNVIEKFNLNDIVYFGDRGSNFIFDNKNYVILAEKEILIKIKTKEKIEVINDNIYDKYLSEVENHMNRVQEKNIPILS